MKRTTRRAVVVGIVLLVLAHAVWWAALVANKYSWWALAFLWLAPLAPTLIAVRATRGRHMLRICALTSFASAFLSCVLNAAHQWLGNATDFPGYAGALTLFFALLCINSAGAIGGALLGKLTLHCPVGAG